MTVGQRLTGATTTNASPDQLVRAVAGRPAILDRPLRGNVDHRWPA